MSASTSKPSSVAALAQLPSMSAGLIVLILSILLGIQPITTDLYLPALPALTESFGASISQAQFTLSALLLAFGTSQLIWGPLSDRFGRRPILLCGLTAYMLASVGSVLAPTMALLIVWRIVQGAAMGAVVMCARAIVRDLYQPVEGAKVLSKGLSGLGLLACLSAPLGGLLSELYGWRAVLAVLAVFGAGTLALITLRFTETLQHKNLQALRPATLLRTWIQIVSNPTFLAFSTLTAFAYGGLFTFLASSSFVFINVLGVSKTQYGLLMFSMSFFYLLGTFLCRRLIPRFGLRKTVGLAACLTFSGGTLMGVLGWVGLQNVWAIMLPHYLFMLGYGIHQPCGQSGSVGPFPRSAGAASALNGFLMMLLAFGMGSWLGTHMDGTVRPLTNGVWFWSVCISLTAWTLVQKYGDPSHASPPKL